MKTYLVTWKIEIDAKNAKDAAKQALTIQRDRDSTATVFDVQEPNGNNIAFDLSPIRFNENVPVLFVLNDDGEANGTVRIYCSVYCREKSLQTNEDPVAASFESVSDFSGSMCESCGTFISEN